MSGEAFKTQYTDEIVCPHCGYEFSDSFEIEGGRAECPGCEKEFEVERDHTVTYSTRKPEPKRDPRAYDPGPPDLSFRDGIPAPIPREGELSIHDTTLSVWEEHVDEEAMRPVMQGVLAVLHARGFSVDRDGRTLKDYPILANDNWHGEHEGRGGKLEVDVRLCGRHLEIRLFQNFNTKHTSGGKYDYGKLALMPRPMRLRCMAVIYVLVRHLVGHGYGPQKGRSDRPQIGAAATLLTVRDAMNGSFERAGGDPLVYFNQHWGSHRDDRDETGFITEKSYRSWPYTDLDGEKLRTGATRLFYERGRLMRGRVYPSFNGQWLVAFGGEISHHHAVDFFTADPADVPRRFVPSQRTRLIRELEKAVKAREFGRVGALARTIERTADVVTVPGVA